MAPLDDPLATLFTLKNELRWLEGARDDALKAADDRTASEPRSDYLAIAASLEIDIAACRAKIAELEAERRLLRGM
jgi:hypothetical protein